MYHTHRRRRLVRKRKKDLTQSASSTARVRAGVAWGGGGAVPVTGLRPSLLSGSQKALPTPTSNYTLPGNVLETPHPKPTERIPGEGPSSLFHQVFRGNLK